MLDRSTQPLPPSRRRSSEWCKRSPSSGAWLFARCPSPVPIEREPHARPLLLGWPRAPRSRVCGLTYASPATALDPLKAAGICVLSAEVVKLEILTASPSCSPISRTLTAPGSTSSSAIRPSPPRPVSRLARSRPVSRPSPAAAPRPTMPREDLRRLHATFVAGGGARNRVLLHQLRECLRLGTRRPAALRHVDARRRPRSADCPLWRATALAIRSYSSIPAACSSPTRARPICRSQRTADMQMDDSPTRAA